MQKEEGKRQNSILLDFVLIHHELLFLYLFTAVEFEAEILCFPCHLQLCQVLKKIKLQNLFF
jgi:hypothetical protein